MILGCRACLACLVQRDRKVLKVRLVFPDRKVNVACPVTLVDKDLKVKTEYRDYPDRPDHRELRVAMEPSDQRVSRATDPLLMDLCQACKVSKVTQAQRGKMVCLDYLDVKDHLVYLDCLGHRDSLALRVTLVYRALTESLAVVVCLALRVRRASQVSVSLA